MVVKRGTNLLYIYTCIHMYVYVLFDVIHEHRSTEYTGLSALRMRKAG